MVASILWAVVYIVGDWYLRRRARKRMLFHVRMMRGKIPESLYRATVKLVRDIT